MQPLNEGFEIWSPGGAILSLEHGNISIFKQCDSNESQKSRDASTCENNFYPQIEFMAVSIYAFGINCFKERGAKTFLYRLKFAKK